MKAALFPLSERAHALQPKAAKKVGAEKATKAETEKAKKPEKAKAATEAEEKPAKKAKQAEQSQAAAEKATDAEMNFAVSSGLAAVFGALNLNEDVRVQCLARTVQWFQELGVRLIARAVAPHAVERTQSKSRRVPTEYPQEYHSIEYPVSHKSTRSTPQCRRVPCCRPVPMYMLIPCGREYSSRTAGWLGDGKLAGKHMASLGSESAELPHVDAHERRPLHAVMRAAHPLPPLRRGRLG